MKKFPIHYFLPLFALLLFPNIGKTVDDIRRAFFRNPSEKIDRLWEWFEPHGGEIWALPPEVVDGIQLLRSQGIKEYSYLGEWTKRNGVEQRLLEGAYPAKPNQQSKTELWLGQGYSSKCASLGSIGEVHLVDCR